MKAGRLGPKMLADKELQALAEMAIEMDDPSSALRMVAQGQAAQARAAAAGKGPFNGDAVRQQLLANGIDEATADQMVQFAAAKNVAGVPGSVAAPLLNPQAKTDPYADDLARADVNEAALKVKHAESAYKENFGGKLVPPSREELALAQADRPVYTSAFGFGKSDAEDEADWNDAKRKVAAWKLVHEARANQEQAAAQAKTRLQRKPTANAGGSEKPAAKKASALDDATRSKMDALIDDLLPKK